MKVFLSTKHKRRDSERKRALQGEWGKGEEEEEQILHKNHKICKFPSYKITVLGCQSENDEVWNRTGNNFSNAQLAEIVYLIHKEILEIKLVKQSQTLEKNVVQART